MSSDIAYFPRALANSADIRGFSTQESQCPSASPDESLSTARTTPEEDTWISGVFCESTDEDLFTWIGREDRAALAVLFHRYARLVHKVARRILQSPMEADDLLQEVFLYIFRKAALFDPSKGSARSWIIQVTYHRAFNRRRQLKAHHFYDCLDTSDPVTAANLRTEIAFYERTLEGTVGKETLKNIEGALSDDQRQTIELYFYEGYSIEEIAQRLGQTPGNVYNHYYRALAKMRKLIFASKEPSK
jgi:RNA polymerase sigma-70 factor (ECF subfamily)